MGKEGNMVLDLKELHRIGQLILNQVADRLVFTRPDSGNFSKVFEVKKIPDIYHLKNEVVIANISDFGAPASVIILLPQKAQDGEEPTYIGIRLFHSEDPSRTMIASPKADEYSIVTIFGKDRPEVALQRINSDVTSFHTLTKLYVNQSDWPQTQ